MMDDVTKCGGGRHNCWTILPVSWMLSLGAVDNNTKSGNNKKEHQRRIQFDDQRII